MPIQIDEEEYLRVEEVAARLRYAPQTIRNLMTQGVFRRGEHFVKPRGRVLFRWSAMHAWVNSSSKKAA